MIHLGFEPRNRDLPVCSFQGCRNQSLCQISVMPLVGFEPTCFRACSLGKCVYQFHHDGLKRGPRESNPHDEPFRLPVFETSAVPVEPDPQILMAGLGPVRIAPAGFEPAASAISPHQHFIARAENRTLQVCSASLCPNNELFLWT